MRSYSKIDRMIHQIDQWMDSKIKASEWNYYRSLAFDGWLRILIPHSFGRINDTSVESITHTMIIRPKIWHNWLILCHSIKKITTRGEKLPQHWRQPLIIMVIIISKIQCRSANFHWNCFQLIFYVDNWQNESSPSNGTNLWTSSIIEWT